MANILNLLAELTARENELREARFVAPCVRGGRVRTQVAGLIYNFRPQPRDFNGWGVFQPVSDTAARVVEEADLSLIAGYLKLFAKLRVRLAYPLEDQIWLAYPVNESEARVRCGINKPVTVQLVSDGAQFEQVVTRFDGAALWFEEVDRRADPRVAEQLKAALNKITPPARLHFSGITPEMRAVYSLAAVQAKAFRERVEHERDEVRLRQALHQGGGELKEFRDLGKHWVVQWTTRDGEWHSSAIAKKDLTVISAGICLSGRDRDFDLQSLVGVVEGQ